MSGPSPAAPAGFVLRAGPFVHFVKGKGYKSSRVHTAISPSQITPDEGGESH